MSLLVVAHGEADADIAQLMCAKLGGAGVLPVVVRHDGPTMQFGANVFAFLLWTPEAERAGLGAVFARLATDTHLRALEVRHQVGPCAALDPLGLVSCSADETPARLMELMRGAKLLSSRYAAPQEEIQSAPRRVRSRAAAGNKRAFVEGMSRGFASSVAVLGIGGGISIGLGELPPSFDGTPFATNATARTQEVGATAERVWTTELVVPRMDSVSYDAIEESADALQASYSSDLAQVQFKLLSADAALSQARSLSDAQVLRLQQLAGLEVAEAFQAQPAAVPQVVMAAQPAPQEETFAEASELVQFEAAAPAQEPAPVDVVVAPTVEDLADLPDVAAIDVVDPQST